MHAGQVCWRRIAQRIPGRPFDTRNEDNRSAGTVTRVFVEASFSSFNLQPKTGRDNSHSGAECAVCIYRIAFSICQERMRNYFRSAGWSSLVARQAHNLKAAGSNPAPATNFLVPHAGNLSGSTSSKIAKESFTSDCPMMLRAESSSIIPVPQDGQRARGLGNQFGRADCCISRKLGNSNLLLSGKKEASDFID